MDFSAEKKKSEPVTYIQRSLPLGHLDRRTKRNSHSLIQHFRECAYQFRFTCFTKILLSNIITFYHYHTRAFLFFVRISPFFNPVFLLLLLFSLYSANVTSYAVLNLRTKLKCFFYRAKVKFH